MSDTETCEQRSALGGECARVTAYASSVTMADGSTVTLCEGCLDGFAWRCAGCGEYWFEDVTPTRDEDKTKFCAACAESIRIEDES